MPGVSVTTAIRSGPSGANIAPASSYFVVGSAERGPVDVPVSVTSLADFELYYGGYNASFTLHQQVQLFFEEGGARVYVGRVGGASPVAGTKVLNAAGATPALTLNAANPGAWSGNLDASVTAAGAGFAVNIIYNDELVYTTGEVATSSAAAAKINASSVATIYVTATATSPSSALVVAAASAFSTGSVGVPSTSNLIDGLDLFDSELGAGAVAIPGQYTTDVWTALADHAVANNRIAILSFDPSDAKAAVITDKQAWSHAGANYVQFAFPYVKVPGPAGSIISLSPETFVAAKRSLAHNEIGPWQAGAGLLSAASWVTGLSTPVSKTDVEDLNTAGINPLKVVQGAVRVYGARSASTDLDNWKFITYRDLLNYIVVELEKTLEDLTFSPVDGRRNIFGKVESKAVAVLDPIRTAGGVYELFDADGALIDPGYSVVVSDTINPIAQLAEGRVAAQVGVRPSPTGEQLTVTVYKSNLTNSVV